MKKILLTALLFGMMLTLRVSAVSVEEIKAVEESISANAGENIALVNEKFSFYDVAKSIVEGNYESDFTGALKKAAGLLVYEIKANIKLMGAVMLIGIFYSFVSNISYSFGTNGINEAAFLCCYAVFGGIAASGFFEITKSAKEAISDMGLFLKSLIPMLATLSAAEGRVVTASLLHTEILTAGAVCSYITEKAVIPLLYVSFALKFINNMTGNLSLGIFCRMTDKLCRRIMGFTLLMFTAMLTLSGFAAGTAENLGLKTARFALSSFMPVAGGALADSVSSIAVSVGMIKNSAGIAGIIAIVLMVASPVIKCAAISLVYSFTGALLEPVCDIRMAKAVSAVGESMGILLAVISVSAVQCIISSAIFLTVYAGG